MGIYVVGIPSPGNIRKLRSPAIKDFPGFSNTKDSLENVAIFSISSRRTIANCRDKIQIWYDLTQFFKTFVFFEDISVYWPIWEISIWRLWKSMQVVMLAEY